jgi:hypothetical protein
MISNLYVLLFSSTTTFVFTTRNTPTGMTNTSVLIKILVSELLSFQARLLLHLNL